MTKLLEFINNKSNNKFKNYKLTYACYNKTNKELNLKFVYDDELINKEDKQLLFDLIKEYLNLNININIKCKKSFVDVDVIKNVLYEYLTKNYENIITNFSINNINVKIEENNVFVAIKLLEVFYNHLQQIGFKDEIKKFLEMNFFANIDVELVKEESETNLEESILFQADIMDDYVYSEEKEEQTFEVTNKEVFVGSEILENPTIIADINGEKKGFVIAGTIKYLTKKTFERKKKDSEEVVEKEFYKFVLNDTTGEISAVYFPLKADLEKVENLKDGINVVVKGDIEKYMDAFNIKVKDISFCELPKEIVKEEVIQNIVYDKYRYVQPTQYVGLKQENLFQKENEQIPQFLIDNTCVVFDLETTGLDAQNCEIIEIGAAKIENGAITQQFCCFVKPTTAIPQEITELTGITDDMVKDAEPIKNLIPDFYKFCENCVIIAHNLDFDYKFLYMAGKKAGYDFNNARLDTLALARSAVKGLKNYKLKTLANHFNVSLENAHRAVHDATATAEVFIKMAGSVTDSFVQKN